ncbi:hypothetical protein [Chryseobacterium indologenes]|uniref:DNA mimic protein DMP19 C-terminal domain-containing protein n=1 Tax=Chryseobacterium indologenes TaxID=253 RepID=A0A0N0ZU59_CHRID|nr:hypothetical protein [Chryseobacterium indologenes]KPE50190.1 hypothetical protein AOB46_15680 [Chryseobacterium indologenes]
MKLNKIIVSETSFNSTEPYDVIFSNISVVNLLEEEGSDIGNIHEDAVASYYVDYYLSQYRNGNFSQFVWNTGWSPQLNKVIKEGLKKMGAEKHLELFNEQSSKVEDLEEGELQKFLKSEYFGPNEIRDKLKNSAFYSLEEDLVTLNSRWLKNHPDLLVLPIEEMFLELEKFIGRKIAREN